ncbi:hypothetical protein R3P38DRAFT_2552854 [Favolaschia claudopus]|uniref:MYND-type domain-containing protein n=1 Tax=Favolaschia claudopus TaxID=2862362 RepID=A0AAW0AFC0_9AGAR
MHESLRIETLSRLPPSIRASATAAMAMPVKNRKTEDLERVRTFVNNAPLKQRILALPAIYANLDPLQIPDTSIFDMPPTPSSLAAVETINRGVVAVETILLVRNIPESVCSQIWSRVLPWAQFIELYHEHLFIVLSISDGSFYVKLLMLLDNLAQELDTAQRIMSVPWFWFILGRSWSHLPTVVDEGNRKHVRFTLQHFFGDKALADWRNTSEFLDGLSGGWFQLARSLISFIQETLPESEAALNAEAIYFLRSCLRLMGYLNMALTGSLQERFHLTLDLRQQVLSQGIIRVLSQAARCLTKSEASDTLVTVLRDCFNLIGFSPSGFPRLPLAIEEGLLHALLACAGGPYAAALHQHDYFTTYLVQWFPASLVDYKFLCALDKALNSSEVVDAVQSQHFKRSLVHKLWDKFMIIAKEYLDFSREFRGNRTSYRACDNLKCQKLDVKTAFRRCSWCRSFYYCSTQCQGIDWRAGGHRKTCLSFGSLLLSDKNDLNFDARQRSFLRALVHHDYKKARHRLLTDQTKFMTMNPGAEHLVLYEYLDGVPKITIEPAQSYLLSDLVDRTEWRNIVARVHASCGRMRLDVVAMRETNGVAYFVIPMRVNTSLVHDRMVRAAEKLPTSAPVADPRYMAQVYQHMGAILSAAQDPTVVEIH